MTLIATLIFSILGLIIGSFLNVVIFRTNTQKTFGGRSKCMSCEGVLKWYDMFPVVSFFVLLGRCRYCKTRISMQYPLVELTTGFVFAFLFLKFKDLFLLGMPSFFFVYSLYATIFAILIVITVYDLRHKIIPDNFVYAFIILSFLSIFFIRPSDYSFSLHLPSILNLFSGILVALPFAFLWFVSEGRWIGFGDAKLAVGIGYMLTLVEARAVTAIIVAFWIGALVGVMLIMLQKVRGFKTEIPFAPFLVLGTFLVFMFDLQIFSYLLF